MYGPRGKPIGSFNPVNMYNTLTIYYLSKPIQYRKHRFIVECITGRPIPEGMVINHINGVKTDNNYSNLEIVTPSENTRHAFSIGLCTPKRGELNGLCELSESTVRSIIRLIVNTNQSNAEIAAMFNISDRHVSSIRHKRRWAHLYEEPEFSDYQSTNSNVIPEAHFMREVVVAYFCLNTKLTNHYLGNLLSVDPSTISRVKNNKLYKSATEFCKQESSTTIENLMSPLELVEYRQATGSGSISDTSEI